MAKRYNEYITIRLDGALKKDFEAFCMSCGMTVSGAVALLVRNTIKEQQIPFAVTGGKEFGKGNAGARQSVVCNVRVDKEIREEFKAVCEKIGIKMSRLIKIFMICCVKNGSLPF